MSNENKKEEVTDLPAGIYSDRDLFLQAILETAGSNDTSWPLLFGAVSTVIGTDRANWLAENIKEQLGDPNGQKAAIIAAAAAGAAIGGAILPAVGSAFGAVLGGVAGYFSPDLLDTNQANEQQEATERAIQYASDEFERLLLLKAQDELEESSFRQEIDVLYEHTCQILTSVLEQENP